ncbi:LysR family transcriptional regulator [uncultured Parolsenella sp.]|uniref:LysR family transcriptional regulator n=1 Tax=uncultured Parolsenella sp. TaxID=2083008 RepID=UPI0025CC9348|nr:LysR family transcriptional regulator [uncultured Parolsenella sp.]
MPNELERELGCTLLDRTNRATMLTEDGMRLRQRAEEIVSLVDQTECDITDRGGELAGNTRIGAGETRAMSVLAEVFAGLRREHPRVTCELFTGNADTVVERLERGLLDFALFLEPVKLEKYEWVRLPVTDRSGVVVAANSERAGLDAVTPEVLARMPLVVSSRTTNRDIDFEEWSGGRVRREDLNIVSPHDLAGNATWLVQRGGLCATCIDHLFHLNDDNLRSIPLDPPVSIGSYVVWKK